MLMCGPPTMSDVATAIAVTDWVYFGLQVSVGAVFFGFLCLVTKVVTE